LFRDIWVQPAAGDAGGALGAALLAWHQYLGKPRASAGKGKDRMQGAYLGPRFDDMAIRDTLDRAKAVYVHVEDAELLPQLAQLLAAGKVVGWFQGRMEFGPRALGGRSILGDPRNCEMQSLLNLKIKFRESFRPFAPTILAERVGEYFMHDRSSPYMLMVAPLREERRIPMSKEQQTLFGIDKLQIPRSDLPAITHVDYSARLQTVHSDTNP
ncbi:MAG: hypothetical protein GY731_10760, partial [Gammaproteobacteria bacterium]|nr:hypothetical protein [Gammaproteobacteria bacterium]